MWQRLVWWLNRKQEQRDLEEELRSHIAIETRQRLESGEDAEGAKLAARRAFGNAARIAEDTRDVWRFAALDTLWQDLRYGVRKLAQSPAFTITATLTLALGIGANTAIFQLLDAVRLRTLPVEKPQELVIVGIADKSGWTGRQTTGYPTLTNPLWERFRETQQPFSGVLAWANTNLKHGRDPAPGVALGATRGLFVSGDFFHVLGVTPILGRVFTAADDRRGCALPGAVLSHGFWQRELGGDRSVIGREIFLNYQAVPVIGVTAREFTGVEVGRAFDVAVPICSQDLLGIEEGWLDDGEMWWLTVMARLAPGGSLDTANAQLAAISGGMFAATVPPGFDTESAEVYRKFQLRAVPGEAGVSALRTRYTDPLVILLAAAGLVLMLACANLANLILSRASTREREYAVRTALGASRWRLVRQIMVENGILALSGTVAGIAVAAALIQVLVGFLSTDGNPLFLNVRMDLRLLAFVAAIAGCTCIAFGLLPAWSATRLSGSGHATEAIRGRGTSITRHGFGLRQALIVSQVALSVVLLFGALLFAGTLANLLAVDPGFEPEGVAVARVDFSALEVPQQRKAAFKREILEAIRSVPGVVAAEVRHVPLGGTGTRHEFLTGANGGAPFNVFENAISDSYIEAIGMTLLAGRDFEPRDSESAPKVALVNQAFVRRFGLGSNPIGETLHRNPGSGEDDFLQVVGLVADTPYQNLREDFPPVVFVPVAQISDPRGYSDFMIRSTASLSSVLSAVESAVALSGPRISVQVTPFRSTIRSTILRERLMATLSGYFGVLAALIAAVGLYGVMSYVVAGRTSEIGVRIALGAGRGDILRVVMGRGVALVGVGLALGVALALPAGQSARSLLFGLNPFDARLAGLACALLLIVAGAASYLPARRAMSVDPVDALRKD